MFFLDEANGGLVDIRMEVYRTSDAGRTWELLHRFSDVTSRCVGFISLARGWIGNIKFTDARQDAALYETEDGGRTWRPLLVRAGTSFEGIGFVTPERGWAGSFETLYSTVDGGATWQANNFAPRVNRIRVLRGDLVYATGDRAYRWTP